MINNKFKIRELVNLKSGYHDPKLLKFNPWKIERISVSSASPNECAYIVTSKGCESEVTLYEHVLESVNN